MSLLSYAKIRRVPANPFGFLPLIHSAGSKSPYNLLLIKDETYALQLPPQLLEITGTLADSQRLLEFYLKKGYATSEMVKPVGIADVVACIVKLQIAIPFEKAEILRALLRQIRVGPRIRYYAKRP